MWATRHDRCLAYSRIYTWALGHMQPCQSMSRPWASICIRGTGRKLPWDTTGQRSRPGGCRAYIHRRKSAPQQYTFVCATICVCARDNLLDETSTPSARLVVCYKFGSHYRIYCLRTFFIVLTNCDIIAIIKWWRNFGTATFTY